MKHPGPPAEAVELFGAEIGRAERYVEWLLGAGVERGLIGPREAPRIWDRHLLNCAAMEPMVPAGSICDLGSGAGLPGVVLALLRPDQPVVLVEPLLRRATFLREVAQDLSLRNVTVVRERAEEYARESPGHDVVVARAVAPLGRLSRWAFPLLRPGGRLLALKGRGASEELAQAGPDLDAMGAVDRGVFPVGEGDSVTIVVQAVRPWTEAG